MMGGQLPTVFRVFESWVKPELRFLSDKHISGASWVSIDDNDNICAIEDKSDDIHNKIAPLVILSFDIECVSTSKSGGFPTPENDPIIMIASVLNTGKKVTHIWSPNEQVVISGVDCFCFETEEKMLAAWAEFVRQVDPDILTGYNINSFDMTYIMKRVEVT